MVIVGFYDSGILYLYCKFSGIPYLDREWRKKQSKVLRVFSYWSFSLYITDVPPIFISDSHGYYKDDITNAIIIVFASIICVIIPVLLALDTGFIRIFKKPYASPMDGDKDNSYYRMDGQSPRNDQDSENVLKRSLKSFSNRTKSMNPFSKKEKEEEYSQNSLINQILTVPLSRESQDVLVIEVQNSSNKQAQNIK